MVEFTQRITSLEEWMSDLEDSAISEALQGSPDSQAPELHLQKSSSDTGYKQSPPTLQHFREQATPDPHLLPLSRVQVRSRRGAWSRPLRRFLWRLHDESPLACTRCPEAGGRRGPARQRRLADFRKRFPPAVNIMDFNVKKLAADAGTFLSRAVQFTEEKLGQAEKTELDAHLENLLSKAECTKQWTEKIMKQTEVLLQPNPNARIEEFVYEKLDRKAPSRLNNPELLGQYMIDAGNEFGPGTAYGNALIKCGETQKRIGAADRELMQTAAINFLTPLRNFIEGDYKTISKERKLLQNKRLDLDAAKARSKKARAAEAKAAQLSSPRQEGDNVMLWAEEVTKSDQELRITQSEFDRQAEITRLLLEGISSTHAHHLRCLNDFVEAQMTYYAQCYQYMLDLQKQLGSFPSNFLSNNNQSLSSVQNVSTLSVSVSTPLPVASSSADFTELKASSGSRKARVLYDYDAANSTELSLLADEVITVYSVLGMDSDWLMGERGTQKGKVPITYLELLN
uniref:Endophilin-B1 n=1 Tax=Geotrypetes seraphini TaxID=260995 RepID=A0A6P8NVB9_GEOSA|nr:endophilin-B1 [Geotrypetes seraphini]